MKEFNELPCSECPSNCNKENGIFHFDTYKVGELIDFPNLRSHLVFVRKGRLRINSAGMNEHICEANNIFLLLERNRYNIEVLEQSEILYLTFIRAFQMCDVVRIDELRNSYGAYKYSFHTLPINQEMKAFVKSIISYLKSGVNCVHMHNAKQTELFVVCRYFYPIKAISFFFYPIIDKNICFESLVKANCSNARNVEELAQLCGYNFHTFKKMFSKYFNEPPYQWMLQQNAHSIRAMIMDHTIPIKAIVADFGFSNQSHLNVYCKRRWGGTAKQIRCGLTQKQG